MATIQIDVGNSIGKTYTVAINDIIELNNHAGFELPDWLSSGVGLVNAYSVWMLMDADEHWVKIDSDPLFTITYPDGCTTSIFQRNSGQVIMLRAGSWRIEGVVYTGNYAVTHDVIAEAV